MDFYITLKRKCEDKIIDHDEISFFGCLFRSYYSFQINFFSAKVVNSKMTKRRSIQFKVSKPVTPALEKAITECVSTMDRRTGRFVKIVVKSLAWRLIKDSFLNCDENEIMDGIKDMANKGKLRLGSNKLPRNDVFYVPRKYKTFAERTVMLPTADGESTAESKINAENERVAKNEIYLYTENWSTESKSKLTK